MFNLKKLTDKQIGKIVQAIKDRYPSGVTLTEWELDSKESIESLIPHLLNRDDSCLSSPELQEIKYFHDEVREKESKKKIITIQMDIELDVCEDDSLMDLVVEKFQHGFTIDTKNTLLKIIRDF